MSTLLRKCRSLISYTSRPSQLGPAVRRNLAQLRGWANGTGRFAYDSPFGMRFVCFTDHATSLRLFVDGYQETTEIDAARAWLRPGDSCIDVGANVGLFTVAFAAAVGGEGHVLAFEPSPIAYSYLLRTVRHLQLNNVVPIASCVSDNDGVSPFFLAVHGSAVAEEESIRVDDARAAEFRRSLAPCVRLSRACQELEGFDTPAILKIDVEGAEPLVLQGTAGLLSGERPPLVVCEIHRAALSNFNFTPVHILSCFPDERFDRYFVPRSISDQTRHRRHGHVYPLTDEQELPIYSNLIAIPRDGWDAARQAAVRESFVGSAGSAGSAGGQHHSTGVSMEPQAMLRWLATAAAR